eukprot:scaffold70796_cov37-Prasinocladus_malaysianus.AAC.1
MLSFRAWSISTTVCEGCATGKAARATIPTCTLQLLFYGHGSSLRVIPACHLLCGFSLLSQWTS